MAKPNYFDLSESQRNALRRDGTVLMNGVRYTTASPGSNTLIKYDRPERPQDLEVGARGLPDEDMWKKARGSNWRQEMEAAYPGGKPSAPSPEQYGNFHDYSQSGRTEGATISRKGLDNRRQSQYYHETGGPDFLGMLDLYEKRKKRGYS